MKMISRPIPLFLLVVVFCSTVDAKLRFSKNSKEILSTESVTETSTSTVPEQETKPYWDVGNDRALTDRYFGHKDKGSRKSYHYGNGHSRGKHLFNGYGW
jgi:hypothetical protein